MRLLIRLSVALLLIAATRLHAQGTAPKNLNNYSVESEIPRADQYKIPAQDGPGPGSVTNTSGVSSAVDATTIRLDTLHDVLALLMSPADLTTLVNFENKKYAGHPDQILAHRKDALAKAISQLKGAA